MKHTWVKHIGFSTELEKRAIKQGMTKDGGKNAIILVSQNVKQQHVIIFMILKSLQL